MKEVGKIEIALEGATFETTERCRRIIHLLFEQGAFSIRNGEVIVSFDDLGNPGSIRYNFTKWRNNKPPNIVENLYQNAKIELIRQPKEGLTSNKERATT